MSVYFILAASASAVKIGTSRDPEHRLKVASGHSPVPLTMAAIIPGDRDLESAVHEFFAEEWMHAEWFRLSPRLDSLLRALGAGVEIGDWITLPIQSRRFRPFGRNMTTRRVMPKLPEVAA